MALLIVLPVATLLQVALIGRHSLWADEFFSLAIATGHSLEHSAAEADPALGDFVEPPGPVPPAVFRRYLAVEPPATVGSVIRAVRLSDTSPPLYYILLSWWSRWVGVSDTALRLFSVLWAVAAMAVGWTISRRLGGEAAAVPAILLFACSPIGLFYATEGRMYSLSIFLAAALMALTLALRADGAGLRRLGSWSIVSAAGLLAHYFSVFVWVACLGWLMITPGRVSRRWLVVGAGVTVLLVLPWYVIVPETMGRWRVTWYWLQASFWQQPSLSVNRTLLSPWQLAWSLLSGRGVWDSSALAEWLAMAAFAALVIVAALRLRRRLLSADLVLVWACLVAACVGPVVFDALRGTMTAAIPRYALTGLPAALILAAVALGGLRVSWRVAVIVLILLAWSSGVRGIWRGPSRLGEPYREVARTLRTDGGAEDIVLVHSIPSGVLGIARYLDDGTLMGSWVGQLGRRRIPDDVQALSAGRARVVLVKIHEVGEPAPEESWLRANATLVGERRHEAARVSIFVPRSGDRFSWSQVGSDTGAGRR